MVIIHTARSACATVPSDLGLRCPLTELIVKVNISTNSKGPDQTVRRLIWVFAVRV